MPPRKKAKKSSDVNVKAKKASTSNEATTVETGPLPGLPLDVLLEIFTLLHPIDLLSLSRTAKSFRSFLLDRALAFMWRNSLTQVDGLPQCPPYMSEPAFTRLVFDTSCYICSEDAPDGIRWEFRIRFCKKCNKSQTIPSIPARLQKDTAFKRWDEVFPKIVYAPHKYCFLRLEINAFAERYKTLGTDDEKQAAIKEREKLTRLILHHSKALRQWECQKERALHREEQARKAALQVARLEKITERLKELGWSEEHNNLNSSELSSHPLVHQPKELTDANWRDIRPKLIADLEQRMAIRTQQSTQLTYRKRFSDLVSVIASCRSTSPTPEFVPHIVDICLFPEVREIMDIEPTVELGIKDLRAKLRPMLPTLFSRWRADIESRLMKLASVQLGTPESVNPLEFAATVFRCSKCNSERFYPAVLLHDCLNAPSDSMGQSAWLSYDIRPRAMFKRLPWSCKVLDISTSAERVKKVIETCGKDPQSTTCQQMDDEDARLTCLPCQSGRLSHPGSLVIMTWRTAVDHCMSHHLRSGPDQVKWERVSDAQAKRAKELEASSIKVSIRDYNNECKWACSRCATKHGHGYYYPPQNHTKVGVVKHLLMFHKSKAPIIGKDYCRIWDSPPILTLPVALLSKSRTSNQPRSWEQEWVSEGRAYWH